jgi:hypothetical protein
VRSAQQASEKLGILSASTKSVIPEVAVRLSGIQKKTIPYWIPDLDFVSSGVTFRGVSRLFQQPASELRAGSARLGSRGNL